MAGSTTKHKTGHHGGKASGRLGEVVAGSTTKQNRGSKVQPSKQAVCGGLLCQGQFIRLVDGQPAPTHPPDRSSALSGARAPQCQGAPQCKAPAPCKAPQAPQPASSPAAGASRWRGYPSPSSVDPASPRRARGPPGGPCAHGLSPHPTTSRNKRHLPFTSSRLHARPSILGRGFIANPRCSASSSMDTPPLRQSSFFFFCF